MIVTYPVFPFRIDFEYHHENDNIQKRISNGCFLEFTEDVLYCKSNYTYYYKNPADVSGVHAYEEQFHHSVDVFDKKDLKGIFYGYNRHPFRFYHIILDFSGVDLSMCPDIRSQNKTLIGEMYKVAHYWKYGYYPKYF